MENPEQKIYEEPELVDAKKTTRSDTTINTGEIVSLRKILMASLVGLGIFLLIVGLIVWFVFWLLFAILPDAVVYVLLAVILGVVLFNILAWGTKIFALYARHKTGKAQFDSIKNNHFK